jgi:hypothetical protein
MVLYINFYGTNIAVFWDMTLQPGKNVSFYRALCLNIIFLNDLILLASLSPGVHSAFNRNEYQKQKCNVSGE